MAKKVKGKKGNVKKQAVEEKKKELQKLLDFFRGQREDYKCHLNTICKNTCDKIRKMYDDKLKGLPESVRNMTLSEYLETQNVELQESNTTNLQMLSSEFAMSKLQSAKKTQKKNRTEKKRSLSVSVCSGRKGIPSNLLSSRVLSESCLSTPISKRSTVPSYVITPKFNPNVPISKNCMRKPRAGEVVLSVSGSPLQNFVDDIAISLGGGKIIKIDDTDITKFDKDFAKKLDEETKSCLEDVKKKLEKILQS